MESLRGLQAQQNHATEWTSKQNGRNLRTKQSQNENYPRIIGLTPLLSQKIGHFREIFYKKTTKLFHRSVYNLKAHIFKNFQ